MPLTRAPAVTFANGKGGVGKTTICANVAALWAAQGRSVLAVDLDAQGNLAAALGLGVVPQSAPPSSQATGRSGLFYAAWSLPDPPDAAAQALAAGVGESGCELAVIDTPPSAFSAQTEAALAASRWLVIPMRCDSHSIDGIATVLGRAIEAGDGRIDPLGVALFSVNPRAVRLVADTRDDLEQLLGGGVDVLESTIRTAERAQVDALEAGVLAGEYAAGEYTPDGPGGPTWRGRLPRRPARNAGALASDYASLASEIAAAIASRDQHTHAEGTGQ